MPVGKLLRALTHVPCRLEEPRQLPPERNRTYLRNWKPQRTLLGPAGSCHCPAKSTDPQPDEEWGLAKRSQSRHRLQKRPRQRKVPASVAVPGETLQLSYPLVQ